MGGLRSISPGTEGGAPLFYRNRHLLALTVLVLLAAGVAALSNLPRLEDPRITLRNAIILTPYPGASAARVEALVSKKIEDRLREVAEIKEIESTSRTGLSIVSIELEDSVGAGTNEAIFSKIRDKLADVERELPAGVGRPDFDDKRGAVAFSAIAAVSWRSDSRPRLGILQRIAEELADRLRNVPGTELVRLYGAPEEEIRVNIDGAELAALGLSAGQLATTLRKADAKDPAGVLRGDERSTLVEVVGELNSLSRIKAVPVRENGSGAVVTIGDVATVERGWRRPEREIAGANGHRAVLVAARVVANVRVDLWADQAREVVAEFQNLQDDGLEVALIYDQSRYTEDRLSVLGGNLLAGVAVVMLIVLIAMGWRAALIVGLALPLSAGSTLFGLSVFGEPIHQMTVFGMIVAIGLLIDNAIVVTDDVRQRLASGAEREQAVAETIRHLFAPLLASTLTTVLGFMPIFLLPGNVGDFVGPIAYSVVLALLASFAISTTVIAALAARFQSRDTRRDSHRWWRSGLRTGVVGAWYARGIRAAVAHPWRASLVALVLPTLGFVLAGTLDLQFFPPAERDQFEVEIRLPKGASIESTRAVASEAESLIRALGGVERVDWLVGASFPSVYYNLLMNQDGDPAYAHGIVTAATRKRADVLIREIQDLLDAQLPEAQIVVSAFGQGPPYEAPVAFRLVGADVDQLRLYGEELRRIMHSIPGIVHTEATVVGGEPKLWLHAHESETSSLGLGLGDLAEQLDGNLEGRIGGSVLEDLTELPVRIRYADHVRADLDRLASFRFTRADSSDANLWVPATAIADLELAPETSTITRRDGERINKVLGYVTEGALPIEITTAVQQALQDSGFALAAGYRLEIAGDSEEQGRAVSQLATYVPVLVLLMIATLVLSFSSFALGALIIAVAALSIGLGMLALWLSGYPLGFNPLLGTAGLVGVAINGSIVVLAAIRANPAARSGEAGAIADVTVASTRHILSTTFTTVGGFLPLVLGGGAFWPPLAVVIGGGVALSTTLALIFTPAAYGLIASANRRLLPEKSTRSGLKLPGAGRRLPTRAVA